MLHPERLLGNLNRALRELRGAAGVLHHKNLDQTLMPVIRRLLLAEVLSDMHLIAVAGSQGAGKTTLVCSMYDLPRGEGSWLQPNQGRGERLPVLLMEDATLQAPQGYKRVLRPVRDGSPDFDVFDDEVSPEQFQQACQGNDPHTLLPVLKLPRRHFPDDKQGLLLLPGYEQQDAQNRAWQELMRQGLVGAAGYVLVTDRTRAANHQQQVMLHDALANEHRSDPVIVVTKTEAIVDDPQAQAVLVQSVGSTFGLDDVTARQRVFCIAADHPEHAQQALPQLIATLNGMGLVGDEQRNAQLARLETVLGEDLSNALADLELPIVQFLMEYGDSTDGQHIVASYLKRFDTSRDSLRRKYRRNIEAQMQGLAGTARTALAHQLGEKHEGFFNKAKSILDTHSQTQTALEATVKGAWANTDAVTQAFTKAVAPLAASALNLDSLDRSAPVEVVKEGANEGGTAGANTTSINPETAALLARLGYPVADSPEDHGTKVTQEDIDNLVAIFRYSKASDDDKQPEQVRTQSRITANIERSIELLPALGLEYMRVASLVPEMVAIRDGAPIPDADLASSMNTVHENFRKASNAASNIMRGLAVVMAADFLVDGKIDSIPAIASILTGSGGATMGAGAAAPAALALANTVSMAIGVTILVTMVLNEVRRHDRAVSSYAHEALGRIVDRHVVHFNDAFDEVMNHLRERLSGRLRSRFHLDQRLMEQDRLAKALADVKLYQRDLIEAIGRSGQTIGLFAARP